MIRSVFAIIGGYITFAVGMGLTTALVTRMFPALLANGQPTHNLIALNLGYAAVLAALAGFVAGLAAGREPLKHGIILATVFTLYLLLFVGAPTPPGEPAFPAWYKIGLLVVVPPFVALGGLIRHQMTKR